MDVRNIAVVVEDVDAARTALQWALHNIIRYGDIITLLHVYPLTRSKSKNKARVLRLRGFQLALSPIPLITTFVFAPNKTKWTLNLINIQTLNWLWWQISPTWMRSTTHFYLDRVTRYHQYHWLLYTNNNSFQLIYLMKLCWKLKKLGKGLTCKENSDHEAQPLALKLQSAAP